MRVCSVVGRKIFPSSVGDIAFLFSKSYTFLVRLAFINRILSRSHRRSDAQIHDLIIYRHAHTHTWKILQKICERHEKTHSISPQFSFCHLIFWFFNFSFLSLVIFSLYNTLIFNSIHTVKASLYFRIWITGFETCVYFEWSSGIEISWREKGPQLKIEIPRSKFRSAKWHSAESTSPSNNSTQLTTKVYSKLLTDRMIFPIRIEEWNVDRNLFKHLPYRT